MAAGHTEAAAQRLATHFARARAALGDAAGAAAPIAFFVPGRIEVLGKHTDYAGGSSITCATERGFCVVAVPGPDRTLRITRAATGASVETEVRPDVEPPAGHWANYPLTVVRRLARNFGGALRGGAIAFSSTLPPAAGMSSSSAMVVAFFLALRALNDLTEHPLHRAHLQSPEAVAQYLGAVESGQPFGPLAAQDGVGTFGGSEDHTAILCAAPGELRRFRYCPVRFEEAMPLPPGVRFVVGVSGVTAEKTGAARERYNRASRRAQAAMEAWRASTGRDDPHLGAAMAAPGFSFEALRAALRASAPDPDPLIQRAEHFFVENQEVIPAAVTALRAEDWAAFGDAVDRSQRAAAELLGNQVPETNFLARAARQHGAVAASSFGAGFGGAVWALVDRDEADAFCEKWSDAYAHEFPARAEAARFFVERPGPAALAL
jgi:galactokinase